MNFAIFFLQRTDASALNTEISPNFLGWKFCGNAFTHQEIRLNYGLLSTRCGSSYKDLIYALDAVDKNFEKLTTIW